MLGRPQWGTDDIANCLILAYYAPPVLGFWGQAFGGAVLEGRVAFLSMSRKATHPFSGLADLKYTILCLAGRREEEVRLCRASLVGELKRAREQWAAGERVRGRGSSLNNPFFLSVCFG